MSHVVRYRVHEGHEGETLKDGKTLKGSIHHPELTEFTGLVTRSHGDGTHDIVIFPPNRAPVHVNGVGEGAPDKPLGPHQLRPAPELELGLAPPKRPAKRD